MLVCWRWFDWSFARFIAPVVQLSPPRPSSFASTPANPGSPGKWSLKRRVMPFLTPTSGRHSLNLILSMSVVIPEGEVTSICFTSSLWRRLTPHRSDMCSLCGCSNCHTILCRRHAGVGRDEIKPGDSRSSTWAPPGRVRKCPLRMCNRR